MTTTRRGRRSPQPAAVAEDLAATRQHPELERVPTLPELVLEGLAHVVAWNASHDPTHYRATAEGQALLNAVMDRNAARLRADPDLHRRVERDAFKPDWSGA